jgi:hypothetical protein
MANDQVIQDQAEAIDLALTLGYPASATVEIYKSTKGEYHGISYAGDPAALFDNAPNNSRLWNNTDAKLWIKKGDIGSGVGGAWTQI